MKTTTRNEELNATAARLFAILEGGEVNGYVLVHSERVHLRERVQLLAPRGYHLVMLYGCGMVRLSVKAARTLEDVGTVTGSVVSSILSARDESVALEPAPCLEAAAVRQGVEQITGRPDGCLEVKACLEAALAALEGTSWVDMATLRGRLGQWTRGTQDTAVLLLRTRGYVLVPTDRHPGTAILEAAVTGAYGDQYHYVSR